ncbi:hypothetical protein C8Q80DRAFT_1178346 [Daedaleopsis nitida]|nr:hypothetical protein C8Q80DRAFT_1178346 [Daedaleopsis nitida]
MSSSVPPSPSLAAPRPLQLVDGNVQSSAAASSCPSPTASGLSTPPPSAQTFNPRRQSSISYYPSDHSPTWDLRSPTTAGPSSLRRSTSLNQNVPARLELKGDRRSLPPMDVVVESPRQSTCSRVLLHLLSRHADLLRFIAQKESRCLELRSQLAAHEAELAQLKRKWERIVSRGMDRAYSQQPAHPGANSGSLLSGAVKDVSRLLAAGLSDLSNSPIPSPSAKQDSPAAPLRTPALRAGRTYGHSNTQSTSSISTSGTSASMATSSVRLSQSSASSLAFDEPLCEQDEPEGEGEAESPVSLKRTSLRVDGGTGIESPIEISPSSAIKAAKLHRRKSREVPAPPSPLGFAVSSTPSLGDKEAEVKENRRSVSKRASLQVGANAMPPAASISGLGPLASPLTTAWMGSVGNSVGKKWEELQKGDTFTKSQKRASLLISDAASSLFAALTSPSTPTRSHSHSHTPASTAAPSSLSASLSHSSVLSPSPAASALSLLEDDDDASSSLGGVLLPDSKPPALSSQSTPTPKSPMTTKVASSTRTTSGQAQQQSKSVLDDDDDDWNW